MSIISENIVALCKRVGIYGKADPIEIEAAAEVAAKVFDDIISKTLAQKKLVAEMAAAKEAIRPVRGFADEVNAANKPESKTITSLNIEIDASQVKLATAELNELTAAAKDAETALANLWNLQTAMRNGGPHAGVGVSGGSPTPIQGGVK